RLEHLTSHPDLDGLAFMGLFSMAGPYFPVLELQARYLAQIWSGAQADMRTAAEPARLEEIPRELPMHVIALRFARLIGAEPDVAARPALAKALLFGPLTALSFRLDGPDTRPDAAA